MTVLEAELAIIGGGGAGCSTALHAAKRGLKVVLLERGLVGSQASGVNYGGVRQQGRHPAELPIAARARALWGQLAELVGSDAEFEVSGHLKLARSDEDEADLVAYAETAKQYGLPLELIGRNAIRERYPFLSELAVAGSLAPDDGAANPRLLSPAIARAARAAGAVIREHAEVVGMARDGGRFRLRLADGTEVLCDRLANTAGFWGGKVAEAFGEQVPIAVLAPNMCVTEPVPYFLKPNLGVVGGSCYARQISRGNVIMGGGRGTADPETLRGRPLPGPTMAAMREVLALIPGLADAQVIRTWTGMDGEMPDEIPVIGPSHTTPGLVHAFGFSGHGFQLGLAIGAIVTELALDGTTPTPIGAFDIARFRGGETP
ncbi:MAG: FAD-binding oxidoreductase [Acetobacteraceae bacterium]|nr:FAD-binding oxidoreductase [Acetobacteraceae bacterium]